MPEPYEAYEPYDVITMGRIGVDLYPLRTGVPLAQVDTFGKFLGGSASLPPAGDRLAVMLGSRATRRAETAGLAR